MPSPSQPPPDLGVLCRKLTSTPPAQLPHAVAALTRHMVRCKSVLSAPQDSKVRDNASQSSLLVHKIKTQITTLLNGRSPDARFAATCLVKTLVDVGGWETLCASEPWVRGLLSILQKGDSFACKELAVVTLTRIYMLLHPYPTLAREIATATLPAFVAASLQIIKSDASPPLTVVETIYQAFTAQIPLYPTIYRPFASQIRSAIKPYLAPTASDLIVVPSTLQRVAGRLAVTLHHVVAKAGGGDDWAKLIDDWLCELHLTADQVFRAVNEPWEVKGNYQRGKVDLDGEASRDDDKLPGWKGLSAGAQRIVGTLRLICDCLSCPTKLPVEVPIGAIMTAITRICSIVPRSQSWNQGIDTNPAISRDEREELWSVMPDLHVEAMELVLVMLRKLDKGMLPLVPELLHHVVSVFESGQSALEVRSISYLVLSSILSLAGPTMSEQMVTSLRCLIEGCCAELRAADVGHDSTARPGKPAADSNANAVAKADLFLPQSCTDPATALTMARLDTNHVTAAMNLLPALLSHVPQKYLKLHHRALLECTAVMTRNRDALLACVFNPYPTSNGRFLPPVLPHLSRLFPHDQALESLRCNMRTCDGVENGYRSEQAVVSNDEPDDPEVAVADVDKTHDKTADVVDDDSNHGEKVEVEPAANDDAEPKPSLIALPPLKAHIPIQNSPFPPRAPSAPSNSSTESQHKRKHSDPDPCPVKRQEIEKPAPVEARQPVVHAHDAVDDDDDDDASVHLNMELEDDDDDDDGNEAEE